MKIRVQSFAELRSYTDHLLGGELEVDARSTVSDVLEQLGVPSQEPKIVLVNGRYAEPDRVLQADDLVVFFPPLEGG